MRCLGAGYAPPQHPNVTSSSADRMSEASYRGTFLNRPAFLAGRGPIHSYMDRNSRMALSPGPDGKAALDYKVALACKAAPDCKVGFDY